VIWISADDGNGLFKPFLADLACCVNVDRQGVAHVFRTQDLTTIPDTNIQHIEFPDDLVPEIESLLTLQDRVKELMDEITPKIVETLPKPE
jgi:hypothetical protein